VIPGRPVPAGLRVPHGEGPGRRGPDASGPQPPRLPHPVQALAADADDGCGVDFGLRPVTICLPPRARACSARQRADASGRGRRRPRSAGHYAAGPRSQRCRRTPFRPREQNTTLHSTRAAAARHQRRRPPPVLAPSESESPLCPPPRSRVPPPTHPPAQASRLRQARASWGRPGSVFYPAAEVAEAKESPEDSQPTS
jgi:hypothetical protein